MAKQMNASETVHTLGTSPTTITLPKRVPQTNAKQIGSAQGKSPNGGGVPSCSAGTTYPTSKLSPSTRRDNKQKGGVWQSLFCAQTEAPQMQMALSWGRESPDREEGFRAVHVGTTYSRNKTKVQRGFLIPNEHLPGKVPPESPKQNGLGSYWGLTEGNSSWGWPATATVSWLALQIATGTKSVCPMLQKAQTQNNSLE